MVRKIVLMQSSGTEKLPQRLHKIQQALSAATHPFMRRVWPLVGLLILSGNMLYLMISHPYSFFNDDITHLFTLNKYVNGGFPISPFQGSVFDAIIVVLGLKALYVPVLIFFKSIGVAYPFIAASKFWGFAAIPLTFFVWSHYLSPALGGNIGRWGALAITGYNVMNEIIPAGLARSFNVMLLGIWLLSLRNRSLWQVNAALIITSLVYPVLLPVMGISLFIAAAWAWQGRESPGRRFFFVATGFVSSTAYLFLRSLLNPLLKTQEFLGYADLLAKCEKWKASASWFEAEKMAGRLAEQNLFQWIQFNIFSSWSSISFSSGCMVAAMLSLALLAGISWRRKQAWRHSRLPHAVALSASVWGGALIWDPSEPMTAVSWWMILSGACWFVFKTKNAREETPGEIHLLVLSAPLAFITVFVLFIFLGYGVNLPGRQLQRPFAVAAPIFAVLWLRDAWLAFIPRWGFIPRAGIVTGMAFLLLVAPPSPKFTYPDEGVMRTLQTLPVDSLVMAYPRTADFILVMAGRNTSMPLEILREAVEPASTQAIQRHQREMEVYYASRPGPVMDWCRQDPDRRYILVEKDRFDKESMECLMWPRNQAFWERRSKGFFLEDIPEACRKRLNPNASLVSCSGLVPCSEERKNLKGGPGG